MPNDITNVLRITAYEHLGAKAEFVDAVLEAIKGSESPFDFNRIITMPEDLQITSGSVTRCCRGPWVKTQEIKTVDRASSSEISASALLANLRDHLRKEYRSHPEAGFATLDDLAARIKSNITKYGSMDWYRWCCDHWGTKWNAYSVTAAKTHNYEAVIHFETAWAPPMPVLDELAKRFPLVSFRLIWCDEGDDVQHRVYWDKGKREESDDDDDTADPAVVS